MADGWIDVPGTPQAVADDGWVSVPQDGGPQPPVSGPDGWTEAARPLVNATPTGGIMKAFGQGFGEAWGPERLGLSKDSTEWLAKTGIFASGSKFENPFQAFNEGVIVNAATALDGAIRTLSATYHGLQAAGIEVGLHRDIVSIPDAFMGSPKAMGEIRMRSGLPKDMPLGKPVAELSSPDPVTAYHGTPYSFDAFSMEHVGKGEGAQAFGHGLYFAENPGVAGDYANKLGKGEGNLYQVRVNVDPAKMLDLDKPLDEQTPFVQDALKRAMGIDYYGNFDQAKSDRTWSAFHGADAKVAVRQGFIASDDALVTQRLHDAGIPGSKYLDEGSRGPIPASMQHALRAQGETDIPRTRNFVIFNENDIQITHKNGEPIPQPADLINAGKDLGVLGSSERPPISEGAPKDVAERVVSRNAEGPKGEKVTQELPGEQDLWQQRFEGFVSKLEAPDDVKNLIRDAARENGDFLPARQGEIPLSHVEGIAEAAGVEAGEVNARGLGRKLQNDAEVRVAMQMMLQVTDDVKNAAREVKADGSPESLIKLQESIMRRDLAVEQVVGLRAEWGRTGNVIQEFMRDVKDQEGLNNFLKGKGRSLADLHDIAHTIDALDRGQAARLLNDMRSPTAWDKFRWYWINALISGPVTHTKYAIANTAFGLYESALVTPVAGAIGTARRALTGEREGVFMGEAAARTWGIVAGVPDALAASVKAARTGMQTALPGEIAQNIIPKNNKNLPFQQKPVDGALGTVIGLPSRGASAIHSFFNFLGYRASIEAQAYRQAAKEGLAQAPKVEKGAVTADDLRSGRAKGEADYHMSSAAVMEPEPYHQFHEMAKNLPDSANSQFQVHGLLAGDRDANLVNLLENGIDPNREFHSGSPRGGVHGVDSTRTFGAPYLLVSESGRDLRETGVKNVVAVGPAEANIPKLQSAFPDVNFMTVGEAERFMTTGERPAGIPSRSPTASDSFWQRRAAYADKPTPDMMNSAIEEGYRLTFINEMSEGGRKMSAFVNATKLGQLVMPFVHIPMNILKRSLEGTPAAFLDAETREALAGKHGAVKQDMAAARMIAGGAVGAWAVNQVLNDRMTGFGPTEQKERAQWLATGHQPYSIRIGDEWYSFNRFGPIGTMMGLYANLSETIPHMKPDSEELTKAVGMAVHSTGRLMMDEVGMQGLAGLIEAIEDPGRRGTRFVSSFAGSLLPYSSMLRQTASAMDPYMRETKSVVDGLRYYIPNVRQGLNPKRDWLGSPIANAGYGGDIPAAPGASAIIQHRDAIADPVSMEAAALDIRPAAPLDRIHGVKLPGAMFDTYQATAGPFLRSTLETYINQPGWHDMPVSVRQEIFRSAIKTTRSSAAAAMQMQYPQLIEQAVKDRVDKINGVKPAKKLHE